MSRTALKLAAGVAAVLACGCGGSAPGPVELDTAGVTPRADYADLAVVLEKAFERDGTLIPDAKAIHVERLDAQLRLLAVTGPTATPDLLPTPEARTAYWYNARAAWALKLLALAGFPERIGTEAFSARPVPLDGRTMTLDEVDRLLAADPDWRTVVAAPCALRLRARMPARPFSAEDIRGRIAERFEDFIDDEEHFVIDVERRRVRIPPVIWQFRDRLIGEYHRRYGTQGATLTTALLPHVSGSAHRRLQDAVGYGCVEATARGEVDCRKGK